MRCGARTVRHPDRVMAASRLKRPSDGIGSARQIPPQERLESTQMARVEAALGPYAWKRMTVRSVALRLVEAIEGGGVAVDDGRSLDCRAGALGLSVARPDGRGRGPPGLRRARELAHQLPAAGHRAGVASRQQHPRLAAGEGRVIRFG